MPMGSRLAAPGWGTRSRVSPHGACGPKPFEVIPLLPLAKVPKFEFLVQSLFLQVLPSPVRVILTFVKLRILSLPINSRY